MNDSLEIGICRSVPLGSRQEADHPLEPEALTDDDEAIHEHPMDGERFLPWMGDPRISYEHLLNIFWNIHDPTQLNRQSNDIGTQYRSVIFYHNEKQKQIAEISKNKQQKTGKYQNLIVSEIIPAKEFYPAEEYHQKYLAKHGKISCKY